MAHRHGGPRSCDTLVAFTDTDGRRVRIFGKNSDRIWNEAQPLEAAPAREHPAGSTVRCQYVTIPQVRRTLTVLGSRPWWLWGFEHGVNEAGVAIGNEAIHTRDQVQETGLLGMDLVRLGLERGATATAAKSTITALLEEFGQGGGARYLADHRYHNSFLIADRREAFVLETSGRHWVSKRVPESAAIANLVTIGDDWDEASSGIEAYARQRGWWQTGDGDRLDFRCTFEDSSMRREAEHRYAASTRFLNSSQSATVGTVMSHLRSHFDAAAANVLDAPESSWTHSICCHPGALPFATTASMVVALPENDREPPIAWCSMGSPCSSVYLPVPVGAALPAALTSGEGREDADSLWWAMYALARAVETDPATRTPFVQRTWRPWETELLHETETDRRSAREELGPRVEEVVARRAALINSLPRD